MRVPQNRCVHCHRWFRPNRRKISIQKACLKRRCQKRRHRDNCRTWREKNPEQDQSRRGKVRGWAAAYPDYWRRYRTDHPDYVRLDNGRRRRARRIAVGAAKRDSIKAISVEKLRELQEMGAGPAAKRDSLDRRVDGLLDYLIWKESAAKRDAALFSAP